MAQDVYWLHIAPHIPTVRRRRSLGQSRTNAAASTAARGRLCRSRKESNGQEDARKRHWKWHSNMPGATTGLQPPRPNCWANMEASRISLCNLRPEDIETKKPHSINHQRYCANGGELGQESSSAFFFFFFRFSPSSPGCPFRFPSLPAQNVSVNHAHVSVNSNVYDDP